MKNFNAKDNNSLTPLVSIIVVTYNSSKYVIETLESIKSQTYKHIELIISDDCSTDETVSICRNWINENETYFKYSQLLTVPANTGIAPNANRGYKSAKGEWIKAIAGDDLLMPECISLNVNFINLNNTVAVFSAVYRFSGSCNLKSPKPGLNMLPLYMHKMITSEDQYELALIEKAAAIQTLFIKKTTFKQVLGFDEEIPLYEDWPFVLKLHKAGIKIDYFNTVTACYRQHETSIYNGKNGLVYSRWYMNSYYKVIKKYVIKNVSWDVRFFLKYNQLVATLFFKTFLNNATFFNRGVNNLLLLPSRWHRAFYYKKLIKRLTLKLSSI